MGNVLSVIICLIVREDIAFHIFLPSFRISGDEYFTSEMQLTFP